MAETSPKWKKPSDVMKLRSKRNKKRTRSEETPSSSSARRVPADASSHSSQGESRQTLKRNPFAASHDGGNKRTCRRRSLINDSRVSDQQESVGGNRRSSLLRRLRFADKTSVVKPEDVVGDEDIVTDNEVSSAASFSTEDLSAQSDESLLTFPEARPAESAGVAAADRLQTLPTDWSLKVKMRIMSEEALQWCKQLKSRDEALGIRQHLTASPGCGESRKADFHACCLHWMHPSLPWLRLFPRMVSDKRVFKTEPVHLSDGVCKSLQQNWCDSFTSVYHLVRSGHCPFFYMCAHHLTVLFRAHGVAGYPHMHALVSPTTRGFRENLKVEGVEFSMPHLSSSGSHSARANQGSDSQELNSGEEDDEEVDTTDEGASTWLAEMGLDKAHFPSLRPSRVKLQREHYRQVDRRPESTVLVEGAAVQGLFNYLLNCRSCTAASGPQAGVPPTLLAPAAFHGATLVPNRVKHSTAKQSQTDGSWRLLHVLEISGPILPHHTLSLASLMCQEGSSPLTFVYNTHEPSVPFNRALPEKGEVKGEVTAEWGVSAVVRDSLVSPPKLGKNLSLREVNWTTSGFVLV